MSESVFRLLERHQRLDGELRIEQSRRWPDLLRIGKLKRRKLAIKDRLRTAMAARTA